MTRRVTIPDGRSTVLSRRTLNQSWDELMQELRATQTGVRILTGSPPSSDVGDATPCAPVEHGGKLAIRVTGAPVRRRKDGIMSVHSRKLDSRGMPRHPNRKARRAQSTSVAAVLLVIAGVFHLVQGLTALLGDDYFAAPRGYFLGSDMVTTWGWVHLLVGVAAVAAGLALRRRAMWARGVGAAVATLSMFASFLWLPFYPVASIIIIALDVFVMWAAFADLDPNAP